MKKLIILLVAVLTVVSFNACTEMEILSEEQKVNVGFEIIESSSDENLKSGGTYDRGTAPVFVSGLKIEARNRTYSDADVFKTFLFKTFGETGGDKMVIEDVTVGQNIFTANSTAEYPSMRGVYTVDKIFGELTDEASYADRASAYSDVLDNEQPLFMEFTASVNKQITMEGDNNVAFDLKAMYSRVNLVFECPSMYSMEVYAHYGVDVTDEVFEGDDEKVLAIVLNDNHLWAGTDIQLEVMVFDADGVEVGKESNFDFRVAEGGKKITKFFKFEGETLQESEITATYEPITEDNSGQEIE